MADHRAIQTIGSALVQLLRVSYRPEDFDRQLEFEVYVRDDFAKPMSAGASLFLYRVTLNGSHRLPSGQIGINGNHFQPLLPLDLHYLLTFWGKDSSLQHQIAGWALRTLEDTPALPYGLLNSVSPNVFAPDESVELILAELTNEDLMRIWEMVAPEKGYQLSIPYLARNVRLESRLTMDRGELIQEREFDVQQK